MQTDVKLKIDNTILLSLKKDVLEFSKDLLYYTALMLYRKNKLSLGKAAELAGYNRIDFIYKLQLEEEIIFDYDISYIEEISESIEIIKSKLAKK